MDRTAGADPGVLPGLHGCILGPDADLAFRRTARADAAKDQTRRPCPRRPLRIVLVGTDALDLSGIDYSQRVRLFVSDEARCKDARSLRDSAARRWYGRSQRVRSNRRR